MERYRPSRILICLELLICLGPVTLIWLFGVIFLPNWMLMLGTDVSGPDPLSNPELWLGIRPILLVLGGFAGLCGLAMVLTRVLGRTAPQGPVPLLAKLLVAAGVGAIVDMYFVPMVVTIVVDGLDPFLLLPMLFYLVLPLLCGWHLLSLARDRGDIESSRHLRPE